MRGAEPYSCMPPRRCRARAHEPDSNRLVRPICSLNVRPSLAPPGPQPHCQRWASPNPVSPNPTRTVGVVFAPIRVGGVHSSLRLQQCLRRRTTRRIAASQLTPRRTVPRFWSRLPAPNPTACVCPLDRTAQHMPSPSAPSLAPNPSLSQQSAACVQELQKAPQLCSAKRHRNTS